MPDWAWFGWVYSLRMKRSPLTRKTPLRNRSQLARGGPPPPVSEKRKKSAHRRTQVRMRALQRAGHKCEAAGIVAEGFPPNCWGPLDVDEIVGRGVRPGGELDDTNVQVLCRGHHQWKHEHPQLARELGLTKRSWEQ